MTYEEVAEKIGWKYEDRDGRGKALYAGDQYMGCEATQAFEEAVDALTLTYSDALPNCPGDWYERRKPPVDDPDEHIVTVRLRKSGQLAMGNNVIDDDPYWQNFQYAGPIPRPGG